MKTYFLYIVISILCVNSIVSQTIDSNNLIKLTIDSTNFKTIIIGKDTLLEYVPVARALIPPGEDKQMNAARLMTTRSVETVSPYIAALSLSNIPTSVMIDKTKDVGEIPLTSSTNNGSLIYTVPIDVHPGSKGIQPDISVAYNSMAGNGVAGYGWSISGLSNISVAHSNYYFDGTNIEAAKLDKSSAYSLDGTRLIKTVETSTQIIYQSEFGNIKVINYAPSKNYYFEVFYPDGRKAIFGSTTNISAKISYPVTRIEDLLGNYIDYVYSETNNVFNISEIKYGSKFAVIGSVKFNYLSRTDINTLYLAGQGIKQDKLLTSIESYYQSSLLRTYSFTYETNIYNFLTKISCKSDGKELNPLVFYYGSDQASGGFRSSTSFLQSYFANSSAPNLVLTKGKFNNLITSDGLIAYPYFESYGVTGADSKGNCTYGSKYPADQNLLIYKNLGDYLSTPVKILAGDGFQTLTAVDINGDGNDELVKINYVWESNMGKVTVTTYDKNMVASSAYFLIEGAFAEDNRRSPLPRYFTFGDYNGDGKIDLLTIYGHKSPKGNDNRSGSKATLINLENKTIISENIIPPIDYFNDIVYSLNHDGDGKSDLCYINASGMYIYSHNNNIFTQTAYTSSLNRRSHLDFFIL